MKKKLHILILGETTENDLVYIEELTAGMQGRPVAYTIALSGNDHRSASHLCREGCRVICMGRDERKSWCLGSDLRISGDINVLIRNLQPDLVQVLGHGFPGLKSEAPVLRVITTGAAKSPADCSAVVASSHSILNQCLIETPAQFIIPHGAELGRFLPAKQKRPFVLATGDISDPLCDLGFVLKAAERMPFALKVAGDACDPASGQCQVPSGAEWLGKVARCDLPNHLAAAEIYLHSRKREGCGRTVVEAAASGCVLVLSGIPELREHWDGAAMFFQPGSEKSLLHVMDLLYNDPALRRAMAEKAMERASRFSSAALADQYLSLYRKLAGEGNPSIRNIDSVHRDKRQKGPDQALAAG